MVGGPTETSLYPLASTVSLNSCLFHVGIQPSIGHALPRLCSFQSVAKCPCQQGSRGAKAQFSAHSPRHDIWVAGPPGPGQVPISPAPETVTLV